VAAGENKHTHHDRGEARNFLPAVEKKKGKRVVNPIFFVTGV